MFGYAKFLTALLLGSSQYIAAALKPQSSETACDFLTDLEGEILPIRAYYDNGSSLLQQHKACLEDKSPAAILIKRIHDAYTLYNLEMAHKDSVTVSVFGGSTLHECDPNWESAVLIGYEFENLGYNVFQGGGAGLMMALRIGSDLFCRSREDVDHVVALICEEKTASSDRQQEIRTFITENYVTCEPQHSLSDHGAFWMTRMPVEPYIGFGAKRVEAYSVYAALDGMVTVPDILVAGPGGDGSVIEFDGSLNQKTYSRYLSPNREQYVIAFNTTAWERNEQVHDRRLHRADIQHANTAKEVIEKTNAIVREKICAKTNSLHACSMYRQPKMMEQVIAVEQHSLKA